MADDDGTSRIEEFIRLLQKVLHAFNIGVDDPLNGSAVSAWKRFCNIVLVNNLMSNLNLIDTEILST